jgi:hypothetical protein
MFVTRTARGFRTTVSSLRSLDESIVVIFQTFSLSEDRCVRLLVKKLSRHIHEDFVREELSNLGN